MRLLEMVGVIPLIKSAFILKGVIENWGKVVDFVVNQFNKLRAILGGLIAYLGTVAVAASEAGKRLLIAWQPSGVALKALKAELGQVVVQLNQVGAAAQQAGAKIGSLNAQGKAAGGGILGLVGNFIKFNLMMFAISATLGLVLERFSAWKEAQDKLASDKRAEEALRRLNTTYKDIGESADEATKRAKSFEESLVNAKYDEAIQRLEEVRKKLAEIKDLTSGNELDFGDYARRIAQLFNPANFDAFLDQRPGELFSDAVYRKRLEDQKKAETEAAKWSIEVNKRAAKEKITLEAQNRVNLEKEIKDIRIAQENDIFRQRQALAQKEVEIFRAAGELRIFQMEQANAKLIEGEEGASAAALESLNSYLSTRERGELDIEAAKKSLVIEVANLEKEISNYRLENEKKIAEIRKRAGDYDKKIADYQRQAAGATGPAITDGFRVGDTGRSTGPHLDIRSPVGDSQKVIDEAVQIIKAWQAMGVAYIQLSNTKRDVKGINLESELRAALAEEQRVHGKRSGGGAIDIAVPEGTVVPRRTGTPSWDSGGGGWMATSLDSGNIFLHGQNASKASVTAGQAPVAQPTHQGFDDIGAPAVAKYAEAVRSLASSMERVRALQQALTEAKTAAAFEAIAKAAFPTVSVEQYTDQIIEAQASLDAYRKVAGQAYDPGLLKIAAEEQAKIAINAKEIKQLEEKLKELKLKNKVTTAEQQKLEKDIADRKTKYLQDLKKEREEREKLLKIQREEETVRELSERTRVIPFDIRRAQVQATASMASTYAGDDPVRQRQIQAEQQILEEKIRLEQQHGEGSTVAAAELADFAVKTRAAAVVLGEMDKQVKTFNETMAMIRDISKTMTDGMKGFVKTILTGGDIQEGLKQMLEGMSSKFLDLALDAAFKPMEQQLEAQLKKFLGLEDPKVALQEANNTLLQANTTALQTLNTTIGGSATGQNPATPTTPGGVTQLPAIPFKEGGSPGSQVTEAEGSYCDALDKATYTKNEESKQGENTNAKQFDFGKALSGATQAFGAIAMGIGGAQQMGKGGTYNTLMGLAGIFGALGSITGMFGTGGIFAGKKASGGPIKANRPYLVGEIGPELFLPNSDGEIVSNAKSRKLMSDAALAGKSQTFASNSGARQKATPSNLQFDFAYQSEVINNVEYVTTDQFRKGMSDSAERGKNMAFQFMQNSVSTRRRLGL